MICEDCKELLGEYGISPQFGCRKCWRNVIIENIQLKQKLELSKVTLNNWVNKKEQTIKEIQDLVEIYKQGKEE